MYCPYCTARIETGNSCPYCNYAEHYTVKPHHLRPGTLLLKNKYLVGRVLGEGGFGITYVGRDLTLDMKVAIKEYYPTGKATRSNAQSSEVSLCNWSFAPDFKSGKEQFIHEARTIAKMDKESAVVTVRDFFEQNNSAYIVMEYVDGKDLRDIIKETQKPMDVSELLGLLEPLFSALGELHKIGLIHRDISPDNIMIENGRARLIDFGCAKETMDGIDSEAVLKHCFSPVEQYKNCDMGPWTDIYAMAATIYYCITGKLPPNAMERATKDELVPPTSHGVKLLPKQERALMKALSVNQEDRYQTMEEFGKDLFVHRNKYKLIAVAACAAAVLATAAFLLFKPETKVEALEVAHPVEQVQVYSLADNISAKEKAAINAVSATISKDVVIHPVTQSSYHVFALVNDTDFDYDGAYIIVRYYDGSGAIIDNPYVRVPELKKGETYKAKYYTSATCPARAELRVQFCYDGKYLLTDYQPVSFSEEAVNEREGEATGIWVEITNQLPSTFTYTDYNGSNNSVTITAYSCDNIGYSSSTAYLYLSGTVDSWGGGTYRVMLDYKITSEAGATVETGCITLPYIEEGDSFEIRALTIYTLKPGNYFIELSNHERN